MLGMTRYFLWLYRVQAEFLVESGTGGGNRGWFF